MAFSTFAPRRLRALAVGVLLLAAGAACAPSPAASPAPTQPAAATKPAAAPTSAPAAQPTAAPAAKPTEAPKPAAQPSAAPAAKPTEAAAKPAAAGAPVTIRFHHQYAPTHQRHAVAQYFAKTIGEKSGGRIKVEIFPSAQLYQGAPEVTQGIVSNAIQMSIPALSSFVSFDQRWQIYDIPFLMPTRTKKAFESTDVYKDMLKALEPKGVVVLANFTADPQSLWNSKRPITKLEDLRGLRIRTFAGNLHEIFFTKIGATAVAMPNPDVYAALQRGTIDGSYSNTTGAWASKTHEVAKYGTLNWGNTIGSPWVVSRQFWDGLDAADRQLIQSIVPDVVKEWDLTLEVDLKKAVDGVKSQGAELNEFPEAEGKRILKLEQEQLWPEYEKIVGKDLLKTIEDLNK